MAFWNSDNQHYTEVSANSSEWQQKENLRFKLPFLPTLGSWDTVRRVTWLPATGRAFESARQEFCALLRRMPNLRVLDLDGLFVLGSGTTAALAASLRYTVHLQQIRIGVDARNAVSTNMLIASLQLLPLTAIYWRVTLSTTEFAESFASLLNSKRTTLQSLEIAGFDECGALLTSAVASCSELQVLHLHNAYGNCCFIDILASLPRLRNFRIVADARCVASLENFFLASRPSFLKLHIVVYNHIDLYSQHIDLYSLFVAIKRNTRLSCLQLGGSFLDSILKRVLEADLVEAGWLTDVQIPFSEFPRDFVNRLNRNAARHEACRLACIGLISARKMKKALIFIAIDVVRMIAKFLMETRNQEQWDIEISKKKKRALISSRD